MARGAEDVRPGWWDEGCAALAARDDVMGALMARFPNGFMKTRGEAVTTLVRAVVGQQISVKAADSIWARFVALPGVMAGGRLVAATVAVLDDATLRGSGLSGQKVKYIRGICAGFVDGTVHPGLWDGMDDEAIIRELVRLPGIGRWTAEMFLMFHLLRPDVLPVDDLGLVKGFRLAYGARWKTDTDTKGWQKRLRKMAEGWRPYRSLAVWYLWRSLDPAEIAY